MTADGLDTFADYRVLLADFLARRRWFAGKGREFTVSRVAPLPWLDGAHRPPGHIRSRVELVTVAFSDGTTDTYQVPVGYLPQSDPGLEHALIGVVDLPDLGQVVAYDGVYVRELTNGLLEGFIATHESSVVRERGGVEFHTVEGGGLPDPSAVGSVMSAEQSNTSIVYGESAILKLFRRVSEGDNPDIEIHDALTRAGFENVAPLLGWLRGSWSGPGEERRTADLGMLQVFLRTATDGWDLALASVRDLLDEGDLHPAEVGGDFASESERLGVTVAAMHHELARLFPSGSAPEQDGATLAGTMQARLDDAVHVVPDLTSFRDRLGARFERLRRLSTPVPIQRVHGDLHLGQTLRTVKGWKLIDFEGEPGKTLAERTSLSSPLRDVAGMLRSFDYAAGVTLQSFGVNAQLAYRAEEWNARNREAFLGGYGSVAGDDAAAHPDLLAAFEADKAIYEAVYETRNRPAWVGIPLHAIARIMAEE